MLSMILAFREQINVLVLENYYPRKLEKVLLNPIHIVHGLYGLIPSIKNLYIDKKLI